MKCTSEEYNAAKNSGGIQFMRGVRIAIETIANEDNGFAVARGVNFYSSLHDIRRFF